MKELSSFYLKDRHIIISHTLFHSLNIYTSPKQRGFQTESRSPCGWQGSNYLSPCCCLPGTCHQKARLKAKEPVLKASTPGSHRSVPVGILTEVPIASYELGLTSSPAVSNISLMLAFHKPDFAPLRDFLLEIPGKIQRSLDFSRTTY